MKLSTSLLVLLIGINILHSQSFKLSDPKFKSQNEFQKSAQFGEAIIYLIDSVNQDTITNYTVYIGESENEYSLEIMPITDLAKFEIILKVEIISTACCSSIFTYYNLLDKKKFNYELVGIYNTHCDGIEPRIDYMFPNQEFGECETVLKVRKFNNYSSELDSIQVLSKLHFNGIHFTERIVRN